MSHSLWAHSEREPELYRAICASVAHTIWGEGNDFGPGAALAVFRAGRLAGAAICHGYQPQAGVIEMSGAGRNWMTPGLIANLGAYAFDQLGCQAVVLRTDPENVRVCRIASAVGFTRHDIPRLRGRDKAEAVFVLGDDQFRASRFARR